MIKEMVSALERRAYKPIFDGLANREDIITCTSSINDEKLRNLLQKEVLGSPEFFYVSGFKTVTKGANIDLYPRYLYSLEEINRLKNECEQRADKLLRRTEGHGEYETALILHDSLAKNVEYVDDRQKQRHTIIGPLVEKKAVCEGFAKAYKYLLNRADMQCLVVSGSAYDPSTGRVDSHAWNLVNIEGEWCHMDVTFDTTIRYLATLRYDYFGLTSSEITRDHTYEERDFPIANNTRFNYYERNHCVIRGKNEFRNFVEERIRNNEMDFVIKLPDDAPDRGLEAKISKIIEESMTDFGVSGEYSTSFNAFQKVFHIHIKRM
jgi:hypothetical protein